MNIYSTKDSSFNNSLIYQNYIKDNPSTGFLKIRAYTANEAIPIVGLKIIVSKDLEGNKLIFYEGITDNSGVIEKIALPAPKLDTNNTEVPNYTKYNIEAITNNETLNYVINIYENVYVVQTINLLPKLGGY